MDSEMKNCPFCGLNSIKAYDNEHGDLNRFSSAFWYVCMNWNCGCEGPVGESKEQALELWNRREGSD